MNSNSTILNYSKLHLFGIELAFLEFEHYQNIIEKFLDGERLRIEKEINEIEIDDKAEPGYAEFVFDTLIEEHSTIAKKFPHNFRASFFVQIISFIEYELKEICEFHFAKFHPELSFSELKGNDELDKAKTYLTKSANIDFRKLDPEWNYIKHAKEVRNIIVHHQGEIILNSNRRARIIEKFIENKNSYKLEFKKVFKNNKFEKTNEATLIIKNKEATNELLENTKILFKKLLEEQLML